MLMAGLDGVQNKIHPGEPIDKDLYHLPPEEAKKVPNVCASLEQALDCLQDDHCVPHARRRVLGGFPRVLHRAEERRAHPVPHDDAPGRVRHVLRVLARCLALVVDFVKLPGMDARKLLLALALGSLAMPAAAQLTEIFKCRDARGQWTYTNDRRQAEKDKCEQVTTQVNVAPPQKAARPSNFPRESSAERAAGKGPAARNPAAGAGERGGRAHQGAAGARRAGVGAQRRRAQLCARRGALKPFQEAVDSHQKNIEALRREIANQSR
jgi:hypothetical protein